ncbi:MAG: hypothetical protein CR979_00385 [Propionibacterium sp.]|nr:MAG: hypothetical protein CR979_00385 [Propionibacterium sp.]
MLPRLEGCYSMPKKQQAQRLAEDDVEEVTEVETERAKPRRVRSRADALLAIINPSKSQIAIAIVLFFAVILIIIGVKGQQDDTDFSTMRRADLVQMLDSLTAESRKLESEIADLERTKQKLSSGIDSAQVAAKEAAKRLEDMRILAGLAPASGPGIRIVITDPNEKVGPEHVHNAIEELRDAGAEVIQINRSIRVVASTWFGRTDDGVLIVDGKPVSFPLTIEAIGDPETLEAGARFRGGLVSEVENQNIGGSVKISKVEKLVINSVATPKAPKFSKPA